MLRTVQQHHVQLSAMADQKASFLIGGSIVLLGIVVGQLQGSSSIALAVAGVTALVTLVLAIFAVMPRFTGIPPSTARSTNVFFFGVFAHIDEEEFIESQLGVFTDSEDIQRALLRDIHQLGTALYKTKYRLLSYAFKVALVGLTVSFLVALAESVLG